MIKVISFTYEDIDDLISNTYILENNGHIFVVDPGMDSDGIKKNIIKNKYILDGVILTHTHFDHMRGVTRLLEEFKCPFYVHSLDVQGLTDDRYNCSFMCNESIKILSDAIEIYDNQELSLDNEIIKVIHTPFHTKGSICLYSKENSFLISGDTVLSNGVGRTDLPSSCPRFLTDSIQKLKSLPDETKIYPGHGKITMLKQQKELMFSIK